jgi:hypothetical protein
MFAPGSGPIRQDVYASFTQASAGGSMVRYETDLAVPLTFNANTRYFVSVVGRHSASYLPWNWAASSSGPNGTFWWQRGLHMYLHLPESRALALGTSAGWPIGTPFCFGNGTAGAACPCGNAGAANTGCRNSTGQGAILQAFGNAAVGSDTVVLAASQCPPGTMGLFFGANNALTATAFGDGLRCVGGNVIRLGIVPTSAAGTAASTGTISTLEGLAPGQLRRYQVWYRNLAGPCGNGCNTSNALAIQW